MITLRAAWTVAAPVAVSAAVTCLMTRRATEVARGTDVDGSASSPPAPNAHAPEIAGPAERLAERQRKTEAVRAEMRAALDARLAEESRDPEWATATERAVAVALSDVTNARLSSARCASTLCRVEIDDADPATQHGIGYNLAWKEPFRSEVFYAYDDGPAGGQRLRTVVYVARKGHRLIPPGQARM